MVGEIAMFVYFQLIDTYLSIRFRRSRLILRNIAYATPMMTAAEATAIRTMMTIYMAEVGKRRVFVGRAILIPF